MARGRRDVPGNDVWLAEGWRGGPSWEMGWNGLIAGINWAGLSLGCKSLGVGAIKHHPQ